MHQDHRWNKVENPMLTEAMSIHGDGMRRIDVIVNMRTVLGGFCRFKGDDAQNEAAKRFKSLVERSMLGGAKAIDLEKDAVDGGGINPEHVIVDGMKSRQEMADAREFLGELDFKRFSIVMIGENGPTAYARIRHRARVPGGNAVNRYAKEIYAIADRLAVHWQYAS